MSSEAWARLQALFEVAISLGPAERSDYLSRACGDDTELRRQIDSLMADAQPSSDPEERLEPLPDGGTRVSFSGLGTSAEWAERLPYFRDATPGVLARLKEAVEGGSRL